MITKPFEIFSGTGGVGKTTLAASRAIFLANQGKSVLLITIDPAKRLKEVLGIKDEDAGRTVTIADPMSEGLSLKLDVQLMNPESTIQRIAQKSSSTEIANNRIMKILSRPYGGLNEILSLVELQMNRTEASYDCIVLDTPPGSHFLDFLESSQKIKSFFDKTFIEIFNTLGKGAGSKAAKSAGFMTKIVSTGVKKLLGYLSKVTGAAFVDDFVEAVYVIYQSKEVFLEALELQDHLRDTDKSNWFLVTSVEQNKIKEAMELSQDAKDLLGADTFVALNKCLSDRLSNWNPEEKLGKKIKNSIVEREKKHKEMLSQRFSNILEFSESLELEPLEQVRDLTSEWKLHSQN